MPTVPFSLRMEDTLKQRLEEEARNEDRSASYLASKAIEAYLNVRAAKRHAIEEAVKEADKGVFVSEEKVDEWLDSWGTDNELPMPKPDIFPDK